MIIGYLEWCDEIDTITENGKGIFCGSFRRFFFGFTIKNEGGKE